MEADGVGERANKNIIIDKSKGTYIYGTENFIGIL